MVIGLGILLAIRGSSAAPGIRGQTLSTPLPGLMRSAEIKSFAHTLASSGEFWLPKEPPELSALISPDLSHMYSGI